MKMEHFMKEDRAGKYKKVRVGNIMSKRENKVKQQSKKLTTPAILENTFSSSRSNLKEMYATGMLESVARQW